MPLPPSGVVHGLLELAELDPGASVPLGNGMSTLFPELIFSAVEGVDDDDEVGVCPVASKWVSVNLPKLSSVLPNPRPSRPFSRCSDRSPSPSVAGQEISLTFPVFNHLIEMACSFLKLNQTPRKTVNGNLRQEETQRV